MTAGTISIAGSARMAARHPGAAARMFYRVSQDCLVSTIGIGTYLGEPDQTTDLAYTSAIRQAVTGGINVVDTAINYRNMHSELNVGAALHQLFENGEAARDELLICTKAGFLTPGAIPASALQAGDIVGGMHCMAPEFLSHQIDRSRENLGVETIDVFYLHNPETQIRFISPEKFEDRLRHAFVRLESLCAQNKIRWYGTATWGGYRQKPGQPERMDFCKVVALAREAGGENHHFRFIQLPFNLMMPEAYTQPHGAIDSEPATILELAAASGLTVICSASIMQARLASGLTPELRCRFAGPASDAQFALQFARSAPGVCTVLAGMSSPAHVTENLGLQSFPPAPLEDYVSLFRREV